MTTSHSRGVNALLQELFADPANLHAMIHDRQALYDRYRLSPEQRAALDEGGQEALSSVGAHPVLQMHHFMATNPAAPDFVSVKAYLPLVKRHG